MRPAAGGARGSYFPGVQGGVLQRQSACTRRDKRHLRDLVVSDAEAARTLSAADVDALFEPTSSYGAAPAMIREVLSDWAKARESAL